jgi:nucleoside permease NupC
MLRDRMREAAKQDNDSNEAKKAATNKLRMLTEVKSMLTKYVALMEYMNRILI